MIAYKAVLKSADNRYWSINRNNSKDAHEWPIGVIQTAPGIDGLNEITAKLKNTHKNYLFAYLSLDSALDYGTWYANSNVTLLECNVDGIKIGNKLFCTQIRPLREVPVARRIVNVRRIGISARVGGVAPIRFVDGQKSPELTGESYGWISANGIEWRKNKPPEWPYYKTYKYRSSTRSIIVGREWGLLEIDRDAIYSRD